MHIKQFGIDKVLCKFATTINTAQSLKKLQNIQKHILVLQLLHPIQKISIYTHKGQRSGLKTKT